MNANRHNIWLCHLPGDDLPPGEDEGLPFHQKYIELTYLRHIVQRPRIFHSGEYLYVAAVDSEEVNNGASPLRYRIVVFRWKEKSLYDRLSPMPSKAGRWAALR